MMKLMLLLCCVLMMAMPGRAQEHTVPSLRLTNTSSNETTTIQAPSGITESQTYQLPASVGTAGQVMTTTSVSGGAHAFGWTTAAAGGTASSDRTATDITYLPSALSNGLGVSVLANKIYRFEGVVFLGRTNDASATLTDQFRIEVTAPTGTTRVWLGASCYNCPVVANDGIPTGAAGTTTATTGDINPDAGTDDYTTYAYSVEGVVNVGSTDGTIYIRIIDSTTNTSTNPLVIGAQSYILLTALN